MRSRSSGCSRRKEGRAVEARVPVSGIVGVDRCFVETRLIDRPNGLELARGARVVQWKLADGLTVALQQSRDFVPIGIPEPSGLDGAPSHHGQVGAQHDALRQPLHATVGRGPEDVHGESS